MADLYILKTSLPQTSAYSSIKIYAFYKNNLRYKKK